MLIDSRKHPQRLQWEEPADDALQLTPDVMQYVDRFNGAERGLVMISIRRYAAGALAKQRNDMQQLQEWARNVEGELAGLRADLAESRLQFVSTFGQVEGERDRGLLKVALDALMYHRDQTRPIHQTDLVIDLIRETLKKGK